MRLERPLATDGLPAAEALQVTSGTDTPAETSRGHCRGFECAGLQSRVDVLARASDEYAVERETQLIGACLVTNGCLVEKKPDLPAVKLAEYAETVLARREDEELIRSLKQGGTL